MKYRIRNIGLSAFICLVSLCFATSCKDKWKKPTELEFHYTVKNNSGDNSKIPVASQADLQITDGEFSIEKARITGKREEAEDIDFERNIRTSISLPDGNASKNVKFDIPQGTYEEMYLHLTFAPINGEDECFSMDGTLTSVGHSHAPKSIGIELEDPLQERITIKSSTGNEEVVFSSKESRVLEIQIQMGKWFRSIPDQKWDQLLSSNVPDINFSNGSNTSLQKKVRKDIDKGIKVRLR